MLRHFGPNWLIYRACHAVRLKSGIIRWQLPMTSWDQQPLSSFLDNPADASPESYVARRRASGLRFFYSATDRDSFRPLLKKWDTVDSPSPVALADDVAGGVIQFFSHERVDVGFPPRWHSDPFTGHPFPADRHWSQIADFGAGDIKLVWETNRFGFVFPLVRAYWRTGDDQYAELFWQLVESWREANSPESGANWKCGQEISLRVMAWCFGLFGFEASSATTDARVAMLAQMIAVSGRRIELNIGYALSQQNNHGLSEAMGLWTIGALFPEFRDAHRWANSGRRLLEQQARGLIYDDGAFSQHSMNYHRVMLQDYIWSIRLADRMGQPFSDALRERIGRAAWFVYQLQEESTGRVPCYGQDDGALILPLNNCGYRDYRPVVQAAHYLATGNRLLEAGPWDEDLLWLFGQSALTSRSVNSGARIDEVNTAAQRSDFDSPIGGYATLRSQNGFAMTRASGFRHRPAQADMLHVDLWWRGLNIALDPGTFSYNAPPPWNNRLAHTAFHNTVTVDELDQMERASRFMWLPWLKGQTFGRRVATRGDVSGWNGEHQGYRRLSDPIAHRRGIARLGDDHWLVVDALSGQRPHAFRLHWLLLDSPYIVDVERKSVELTTSAGAYSFATNCSVSAASFQVTRAATDSAVGWRSSFYHSLEPALSVSLSANAPQVVFATVFGPDAQTPAIDGDRVIVAGPEWQAIATLDLTSTHSVPLLTAVDLDGAATDADFTKTHLSSRRVQESLQCTSF